MLTCIQVDEVSRLRVIIISAHGGHQARCTRFVQRKALFLQLVHLSHVHIVNAGLRRRGQTTRLPVRLALLVGHLVMAAEDLVGGREARVLIGGWRIDTTTGKIVIILSLRLDTVLQLL